MLATGKFYEVFNKSDELSATGRAGVLAELLCVLQNKHGVGGICCGSCFNRNFTDWNFAPILAKGGDDSGSYGKLTTRLSKFCHETFSVKLTAKELAHLGDLINHYTLTYNQIQVDFTPTFDWVDGDFGDEGSCFWHSKKRALDILTEHNVHAMRMWQNGVGVGRAWVWEHPTANYFVFNGYGGVNNANGKHSAVESKTFAVTLAEILHNEGLDAKVKKISLLNNGVFEDLLWINNGTGYIVGELTDAYGEPIDNYDFRWPLPVWQCSHCGCRFGWKTQPVLYAEHQYCDACYNDNFITCNICCEIKHKCEVEYRYTRAERGQYVCDTCYATVRECPHCGRYALPVNMLEVMRDGKPLWVCSSHRASYNTCRVCGKLTNTGQQPSNLYLIDLEALANYQREPWRYQFLGVYTVSEAFCSDTCAAQATTIDNYKTCPNCGTRTNYILTDGYCPMCSRYCYDSVEQLIAAGLLTKEN